MPEFDFSDKQNKTLEAQYAKNPYPTFHTMRLLAQSIGLTNLAISVWFMARREREHNKENQRTSTVRNRPERRPFRQMN